MDTETNKRVDPSQETRQLRKEIEYLKHRNAELERENVLLKEKLFPRMLEESNSMKNEAKTSLSEAVKKIQALIRNLDQLPVKATVQDIVNSLTQPDTSNLRHFPSESSLCPNSDQEYSAAENKESESSLESDTSTVVDYGAQHSPQHTPSSTHSVPNSFQAETNDRKHSNTGNIPGVHHYKLFTAHQAPTPQSKTDSDSSTSTGYTKPMQVTSLPSSDLSETEQRRPKEYVVPSPSSVSIYHQKTGARSKVPRPSRSSPTLTQPKLPPPESQLAEFREKFKKIAGKYSEKR